MIVNHLFSYDAPTLHLKISVFSRVATHYEVLHFEVQKTLIFSYESPLASCRSLHFEALRTTLFFLTMRLRCISRK